jgi:hypothetical protein
MRRRIPMRRERLKRTRRRKRRRRSGKDKINYSRQGTGMRRE